MQFFSSRTKKNTKVDYRSNHKRGLQNRGVPRKGDYRTVLLESKREVKCMVRAAAETRAKAPGTVTSKLSKW